MKKYAILTLLLFVCFVSFAQDGKQITYDELLWIRYFNTIKFDDSWSLTTEIENRRFIRPDRQQNWLIPRIQIVKSSGNWNAGLGITYLRQSMPNDGSEEVSFVRPEIRPHQEFSFKHKSKSYSVSHRYRFEERFIHKYEGTELTDGYDFTLRFRYRLQFSFPMFKNADEKALFDLKLSDEIMLNLDKDVVYNIFDQNRLYAGVCFPVHKSTKLEGGYLNIFQQRSSGNKYNNVSVLRFTIYQTINLKNQKL